MNEKNLSPLNVIYIIKIILGLIVLGGLVVAAYELSLSGLSPFTRHSLLAGLIIVAASIIPFISHIYRKSDELQKVLHQNACVSSLSIITAASAIIGMLQVNDLLSVFNQFWTLGMTICVWAVNLMLVDRQYK